MDSCSARHAEISFAYRTLSFPLRIAVAGGSTFRETFLPLGEQFSFAFLVSLVCCLLLSCLAGGALFLRFNWFRRGRNYFDWASITAEIICSRKFPIRGGQVLDCESAGHPFDSIFKQNENVVIADVELRAFGVVSRHVLIVASIFLRSASSWSVMYPRFETDIFFSWLAPISDFKISFSIFLDSFQERMLDALARTCPRPRHEGRHPAGDHLFAVGSPANDSGFVERWISTRREFGRMLRCPEIKIADFATGRWNLHLELCRPSRSLHLTKRTI